MADIVEALVDLDDRLFAQLFEDVPVGLAIVGLDLRYQSINRRFAQAFGISAPDALGRTAREVQPGHGGGELLAAAQAAALQRGRAGAPIDLILARPTQPSRKSHWRATCFPLRRGNVLLGVGTLLEDGSERAKLLQRQQQQVREGERARSEFVALLAHELRNPLATISYATELLTTEDTPAKMSARAAVLLREEVRRFSRLVDDLMDVSRLERGVLQLQRETIDLRLPVAYAVDSSRPLAERRRLHLELTAAPGEVRVLGDAMRLTQVVTNLLDNALKFTAEGGTITVDLGMHADKAVLKVVDTGVGIPQEQLHKVFEPFWQGRTCLDRAHSGIGLGLALVDEIVRGHGGTVEARSEGPGRGSTFVVVLPLDLRRTAAVGEGR